MPSVPGTACFLRSRESSRQALDGDCQGGPTGAPRRVRAELAAGRPGWAIKAAIYDRRNI